MFLSCTGQERNKRSRHRRGTELLAPASKAVLSCEPLPARIAGIALPRICLKSGFPIVTTAGADALPALLCSHPLSPDGRKSGTFSPGVFKQPLFRSGRGDFQEGALCKKPPLCGTPCPLTKATPVLHEIAVQGYFLFCAEEHPVGDHALFMEGLQELLGGDVPALLTGQLQHNFSLVHHNGPVAQLQS